jgi:dolichol-phosphate mannosyltransferase
MAGASLRLFFYASCFLQFVRPLCYNENGFFKRQAGLFLLKRFVKFSVVGLSGTLVNMAVYAVAVQWGLYYLMAAVVSFVFAVTNNFFWNFRWTFKGRAADRSTRNKYFRFLGFSVFNLGVNLILLRIFVETMSMDKTLAQLLAIGLVSVLNFGMNARFTFGEKRIPEKQDGSVEEDK